MLDHGTCRALAGSWCCCRSALQILTGAGAGDHHGAGQLDLVLHQDTRSPAGGPAQGVLDHTAGIEVAAARKTTLPLVCF